MKYIKTFEGLIKQMNTELKAVKQKYGKEIAECLSVIQHEHELKLKAVDDYSFEYHANDLNLEPSDELKRDFKLAKKKLESVGLDMDVTFSLHSSAKGASFLRANLIDLEHSGIKQNIKGIIIKIYDLEDID